jgi:hypothetical protein
VLHRVAEAAQSTTSFVRIGVIVAVDHPEQRRMALRQNVARGLVDAMGAHEGELVLAGDSDELSQSRHELFVLAGTLCDELRGRRVNVRVRFSTAKSGVMAVVTPSSPDVEALSSKL